MELKFVTLNCWGLYSEAQHIKERFKYIAKELEDYDVACLQEVWEREDYDDLTKRLASTLPHSHHFVNSSYIGSGLCIFSKYPILSVISHQFRVTGGMRIFYDGEVFAGKGVLCCKLQTPQGTITIFNTHINPRCRDSQIFEIMQLVGNVRGDDPVIVCGDFNTKDSHAAYRLMTECLLLSDVYSDEPDAHTCDISTNVFTKSHMANKRIDFVFHSEALSLQSRKIVMTGNIPGREFPYSDHEAVEAVFSYNSRADRNHDKPGKMNLKALQTLQTVSDKIKSKKEKHYKKSSLQRGIVFIAGLMLAAIAMCILLPSLVDMYSGYSLHWLTTPISMMFGALLVMVFFFMLNENHLHGGMDANIHEIDTILLYHRFQA